ncbi:RNA-binding domain-containing protein [Clostridium sp. UBA6640]|uniref:RNA-binding domain-containing protein n=1 Tax=Clostridium sp. UBA6640 TaxID=1946370 RepID=UPI0025BCDAEE|nr:RNA-binding domain-containing protein [Clostridium sp. UBA6640]
MIDIDEVINLIKNPTAQNIICRKLEFRPQNIAFFIAALANMDCDYGYIVIGISKDEANYIVHGISAEFNMSEPIKRALSLVSDPPLLEWDRFNVSNKNIYVIKVVKAETLVSLTDTQATLSPRDSFIRDLYLACIKLQSRRIFIDASEDERNDFIGDLLQTAGYNIKDQTRRGVSATGKLSGEIDLFIENNGMPFTIIEALNLSSLNTSYLNAHLDKIYSYDTAGNLFNVCLVYVKTSNFSSFWEKYCNHVKQHIYPVMLVSSDTDADKEYPCSEIRFITTTHNRSGKTTVLYHMCVRIHD